jgi:hypothetical protein
MEDPGEEYIVLMTFSWEYLMTMLPIDSLLRLNSRPGWMTLLMCVMYGRQASVGVLLD